MTPAARVQAAIDILEELAKSGLPADRFLREWFRARRYAGSKDRASVAERVFDIFRHRASYAWRMKSEAPRALAIASLLAQGEDVEALFAGTGYGPAPLTQAERAAIASPPDGPSPLHVQGEFPAFLEEELRRSLGGALLSEMQAMQARAPVDLRVNTLKSSRNSVLARLRADGFDAAPTPYSPLGIRIAPQTGLAALHSHECFARGEFEFQDEAAQIAVLLAGAKPGQRVLDLAAGAGGKALALAAQMNDEGEIVATDIDVGRLMQIDARADRAGAKIIRRMKEAQGLFDLVFVDAPCSGSGTWRRQPEQKWRLTPERVAQLVVLQDALLEKAAGLVRPGGRLLYATCSLFASENEDRIAAFLARHPEFVGRSAAEAWREAGQSIVPAGMAEFFRATPAATGTDGFFAAILVHKEPPCTK